MIAALNGNILTQKDETLVLDVGGVGYEVIVTSGVLSQNRNIGDKISLIVYTDVRETAIVLFGFINALEREVFLLLKKVKGVGSRMAITILSAVGAENLLSGIGQQDIELLKRIPGVGKKTAERLIVELREVVGQLAYRDSVAANDSPKISRKSNFQTASFIPGENGLSSVALDAVLALEKLGFSSERARQAVSVGLKNVDPKILNDPGELLKVALAHL